MMARITRASGSPIRSADPRTSALETCLSVAVVTRAKSRQDRADAFVRHPGVRRAPNRRPLPTDRRSRTPRPELRAIRYCR
jgi:hypothetical protein